MINLTEDLNFDGYTLLIACVSVGNLSQMSADLLINSLKMKRLGTMWHPACAPISGVNPYGYNHQTDTTSNYLTSLNTALEIFHDASKKIAILQMRSSINNLLKQEFVDKLVDFLSGKNFTRILILSSCYSCKLTRLCDAVYRGTSAMHYTGCNDVDDVLSKSPNWIRYDSNDDNGSLINSIPGCAKALYEKCMERSLPVLLIFRYCTDGDNKNEAFLTTSVLNELVDVLNEANGELDIVVPKSWNYLYGNIPPDNIF